MDKTNEIINLLERYLQKMVQPTSGFEYFVKYWLPVIQVSVIVLGAISGIYKYYSSKNKEANEKILNDVYAPLFRYFIKQELYCKIHGFQRDYKKSPILELTSHKVTQKLTFGENSNNNTTKTIEKSVLDLHREEFFKVLDTVNIGLIPKSLYTLLSMYEVLVYMESNYDKTSNEFLVATIEKVEVENALRKEIIIGYQKYNQKLGSASNNDYKLWKIENDNIEFLFEVSNEEKEKLKEMIDKESRF